MFRWLFSDITKNWKVKIDRYTAVVDRWMMAGRLLFLEDQVKRLKQLIKPSA